MNANARYPSCIGERLRNASLNNGASHYYNFFPPYLQGRIGYSDWKLNRRFNNTTVIAYYADVVCTATPEEIQNDIDEVLEESRGPLARSLRDIKKDIRALKRLRDEIQIAKLAACTQNGIDREIARDDSKSLLDMNPTHRSPVASAVANAAAAAAAQNKDPFLTMLEQNRLHQHTRQPGYFQKRCFDDDI